MTLVVTHPTAADASFSAAGATAWNENHAVTGTVDFATEVANKPTTLAGYGITDAQPLDTQLTSLAGLAYAGNSLKAVRVNAGETDFELASLTTSIVSEGTNLYFTDERAQDAVGTILTDSATVDFTYNDAGNTITAAVITTGLSLFNSADRGVVSGSGGGTTNFLRADGSWAAPATGGVTKISGNTGAFVADTTWETLSANSSDITSTTQTTVMTMTGVGTGTYRFKGLLVFQTAATTTGIGITANHTGTVSRFVYNWYHVTTGGAAATGISDQVTATAAGQLVEGKAERVKDTRSSFTVGVDTQNADELAQIEGIFIVTATGSFEIKIATEVAASAVRLMAGSTLELHKIA